MSCEQNEGQYHNRKMANVTNLLQMLQSSNIWEWQQQIEIVFTKK
jgi:hypothetical protein